MAIPRIDVHSTRAVIEIHREPMRLRVQRTAPRMKVTHTRPKFKIANSRQLLGTQVGRRGPDAQRQKMIQQARAAMTQGIQKANDKGERLSNWQNIGSSPNVVAQLTLSNMINEGSTPIYDTAPIPSPLPEMEWDMGDVSIDWEQGDLEMEWEGDPMPEISVTPHSVEIRLISGEVIRVGEQEAESIERQGYGKRLDKEV